MNTKIILLPALILLSLNLAAQPQGAYPPQGAPQFSQNDSLKGRPQPPKMKSPTELATIKADMMRSEVNLTDKQYKKVFNLFKKDFQYRQDAMKERMQGGMPPQGGPGGGMGGSMGGGMGGPGGGMGGGMMGGPGGGMGGGMMGGSGGGMGQGMPPQGDFQNGERPDGGVGMGGPRPGEDVITEEYLEKQDKKLRKILTVEQYEKWSAKHPAEHLELPPIEMKM